MSNVEPSTSDSTQVEESVQTYPIPPQPDPEPVDYDKLASDGDDVVEGLEDDLGETNETP